MAKTEPRRPGRPATRSGPRVNLERRPNAGVLRPDEMYTMEEVSVRLEQGPQTIREAFNNGLPSYFFGKRKYVRGCDLIAFLTQFRSVPGSKNPPPKPAEVGQGSNPSIAESGEAGGGLSSRGDLRGVLERIQRQIEEADASLKQLSLQLESGNRR